MKNSSLRYSTNIATKNSAEQLVIIEVESNWGVHILMLICRSQGSDDGLY